MRCQCGGEEVIHHGEWGTEIPSSFLIAPQSEFRLGVRFYTEEQPAAAILHLEKALEEYFVADTECRALCEGPYDYEGYNYLEYNADLFQAITGGSHAFCVLSQELSTILGGLVPKDLGWGVPEECKPHPSFH